MTTRLGLMSEHEVRVGLAGVIAEERRRQLGGQIEQTELDEEAEAEATEEKWQDTIDFDKAKAAISAAKAAVEKAERSIGNRQYAKALGEASIALGKIGDLAHEGEQHTGRHDTATAIKNAAHSLRGLSRQTRD